MSEARRPLAEALLVYGLAAAAVALLPWVARGPLSGYQGTLAGAVYLLGPMLVCRVRRLDPDTYAPLDLPRGRHLLVVLALVLVAFPPFYWAGQWLGLVAPGAGLALPKAAGAGKEGADLVLALGSWVLSTGLVVALPEELLFRGYLQRRLDDALPGRVRLLGVEVGHSLWLGALLFAAAHVLTVASPLRLFTFFPGLVFGMLRAHTRGIGAGTLFHTLCNLYIDLLAAGAR